MKIIIELDENDIQVIKDFARLPYSPCHRCREIASCCGCPEQRSWEKYPAVVKARELGLYDLLYEHQKALFDVSCAEEKLSDARHRLDNGNLPDWVFQPGASPCKQEDLPDWAFQPGSWEARQ